jgi:2-aminoethylphosphonate-pyruvate transaminase
LLRDPDARLAVAHRLDSAASACHLSEPREVNAMLLLIPGPVTTRPEVRAAMAEDFAPWDDGFTPILSGINARLLAIAGGMPGVHAVLMLQGCGHFAIEASLRSLLPPGGRILVPLTGSYAERMARLAREAGREVVPLPVSPMRPIEPAEVARALAADATLSHVGLVYSETSSGVVHDAVAIGAVVRNAGRHMILDAVSAFGALPVDLARQPEIEAMVFTANKCLEGVPGVSFVAVRTEAVPAGRGWAESWSFDLCDVLQHERRDGSGGPRFTPPTQVLAALRTALALHEAEGGAPARLARYRENVRALQSGLHAIGLSPYLADAAQGPIVLNVHAPGDPRWTLAGFVAALKTRGFLISNFYNTARPSFRVGCIGAVEPADMRRFVAAVDDALRAMGVQVRAPAE